MRWQGVDAEYTRKARTLDQHWCATQAGDTGPLETKLRGYGAIRAAVFGAWAEASDDVDWLLNEIADLGARHSLPSGRDPQDVRVALLASLQRRWGMIAARANAQLLLDRMPYVGSGASSAAARRRAAHTANVQRMRRMIDARPSVWNAQRGA